MKYTHTQSEREPNNQAIQSTRQSNVIKRVFLMLVIGFFLVFAGAQTTTTTTQAMSACDVVCGEPYIDPSTGQCYVECCPANPDCKSPCVVKPCK